MRGEATRAAYWEQEFTQLKPVKRRGNRRYYQHHEVLLIRRIRELLYAQGFTINGARNRLEESALENNSNPSMKAPPGGVDAAIKMTNLAFLRKEIKSVLQLLQS